MREFCTSLCSLCCVYIPKLFLIVSILLKWVSCLLFYFVFMVSEVTLDLLDSTLYSLIFQNRKPKCFHTETFIYI